MRLIEILHEAYAPNAYIFIVTLAIIYAISSGVFLLLDNRTVQPTFAWMLLFYILPIVGLTVYIFFGRDWKAFSKENKPAIQEISSDLYQKGYYHPKTISIDSAICAIGTANMDIRSYSLNYEASAVIYDAEKATELEQTVLADLKDSTEFNLEAYLERPILLRLRDSVSRLASPVL